MPSRPEIPAELLERHRLFNRNSEGLWDAFSGHRAQVNALLGQLLDEAGPHSALCVVGAGNCNDLELAALARRVRSLHLVDVDEDAVQKGLARQNLVTGEALQVHAPVDVTGLLPQLKAFAQAGGTDAAAATTAADAALANLPGPFPVVVSACVLSQLMHTCRLALGADHPALHQVAHSLVLAHLRALSQLTTPGGKLVLLSDTASSQTYPLVELWDAQPPRVLLERLEREDNVLSGTGSIYLRRLLARDPVLRTRLASTRLVDPWLWQLGDDVTLLAYGLVATRAA